MVIYYITHFIFVINLYSKWIFINLLYFRRNERWWCHEALEIIKRHLYENYCWRAAAEWLRQNSTEKVAVLWPNVFSSRHIVKYTVRKFHINFFALIVMRTIRDISFCRTISNESQRQSFSEEDASSSQTSKHFYSFNSREVFDNKVTILQWRIYEYYFL